MQDRPEFIVVLVTAPSREEAVKIARTLVHERLVPCANLIPKIESVYWWDNEVQENEETLCIIKARSADFEAVRQRVLELHSYEVPEIIAVPITAGHDDYFSWFRQYVK